MNYEEFRSIKPAPPKSNFLASFCLFVFAAQYMVIGGIGAYDTYLSIKYRDSLYESELNPIGRWLIEQDQGDVALFMGIKMAGTILALGILSYYFSVKPWRALLVGTALCGVQVAVLLCLEGYF